MKKFIFSLLLSLFGLISFLNGYYLYSGGSQNLSIPKSSTYEIGPGICIKPYSNTIGQNTQVYENGVNIGNIQYDYRIFCFSNTGYIETNDALDRNFGYTMYDLNSYISGFVPECETCPEVNTGEILSGYIAIKDVTTNYCVSNDLCPEMSGGNSAIYINDIRHESMPFINIRIPEEIERNYEYTGNNTQLDISVEGYGYDQEKMQNMINTQYYTPTSEEMSSLIGKIADFLPLIAIALLIIRIRRVLKKVFRL